MLQLAALTATALAAMAVPASADWVDQRLRGAAHGFYPPALGANARGDVAVVWGPQPNHYLAVRRAGRARFGSRIALPDRGTAHRVAVLSDGTVLVGWLGFDGTSRRGDGPRVRDCCLVAFVQRLRPGSRRLSASRVATTRGEAVGPWSLAGGPGGRAALLTSGPRLVTSRRAGVFGRPVALATGGDVANPVVGFGGDGRGIGLWVEGTSAQRHIAGAPIGRDGRVGAARTYVPAPAVSANSDFFELDAGVDRRSRATAIWTSRNFDFRAPHSRVIVATGDVGGRLGRQQVLDDARTLGTTTSDVALDVASSGRAIAVWHRSGPGGGDRTGLAIRRSARGPFRVLPALTGGSGTAAILPSGRGVVVYRRQAPVARPVAPDGRLGPSHSLAGLANVIGRGHVAAVATAGRVTLAWGASDGLRVTTYRP